MDIHLCLHGKPQSYTLVQKDLDLFHTADIAVPQCRSVILYKKIHLVILNRIIKVFPRKRTMRDNSGVVFKNSAGIYCYGRLQKVLCLDYMQKYAIVQKFSPSTKILCEDSLTNAKLNDHIIAMNVPRSENFCDY